MAIADKFLSFFPEFSDTNRYPRARIEFWASIAQIQLDAMRWGNLYEYGVDLYIAHKLTLEYANQQANETNGNLGDTIGPINNRTIADVSYSVDTARSTYEHAGYWNETIYGRNFWQLSQQIGAGVIQLGISADVPTVATGVFPF